MSEKFQKSLIKFVFSHKFLLKRLLKHHADERLSIWNDLISRSKLTKTTGTSGLESKLGITSKDFADNETLPLSSIQEPQGGSNKSPSFQITNIPTNATHLLVILEDLDVPFKRPSIHTAAIKELAPNPELEDQVANIHDINDLIPIPADRGRTHYVGPMPPAGHGPHRYEFQFYAVKFPNNIDELNSKNIKHSIRELQSQLPNFILAAGKITGIWENLPDN
jgi:phosphatidylethanolamine-binding protein (PEBP) family uncharacterized protein